MSAESSFVEAVTSFTHGNRYDNYLRVVRLGLNARNGDAEAVADYILANAPPPRPNSTKIRSAIAYALAHDRETPGGQRLGSSFAPILSPQERQERRRLLLPQSARQFVPVTLRNYGRAAAYARTATAASIGETILLNDEELFLDEAAYRLQAARQLRALHSSGMIWAGTIVKDEAVRHRLGIRSAKTPINTLNADHPLDPATLAGIVRADIIADRIERGDLAEIPTHISLNPQTGEAATEGRDRPSYDCKDSIAAFRNVLIEFDDLKDADGLPSQAQIDIVAGLIDYAQETRRLLVTCAVWTGGKSIHVALRVKADTLDDYRKQCTALADLFASADDAAFRIDTTGWATGANAATHIRLAGATRPETGRRARLLFCR